MSCVSMGLSSSELPSSSPGSQNHPLGHLLKMQTWPISDLQNRISGVVVPGSQRVTSSSSSPRPLRRVRTD